MLLIGDMGEIFGFEKLDIEDAAGAGDKKEQKKEMVARRRRWLKLVCTLKLFI